MTTHTNKLLSRLQKVECPDTTYIAEDFPIVMKRASGMWVHDVANKRYLDFTACFGVLALGHRSKVTVRTLRKQSAKLIHGMGDVHPSEAKIKLLELLAKITPYANAKSILGQSGGDAVEAAIKTSILATNRSLFLSFSGGYHGLQFAPLSLNDNPLFTHGFESWLKEKNVSLPFPHIDSEDHVLEKVEDELKKKLYAAIILEPIQGRGGMREFSPKFIRQCNNLCHKYGTLLIFDEIFTGFGRTGKMFAWEHSGVIPDLLCIGKGMGGGLPLSACIGDILDVWGKSRGEARHTQTFLGHPLACAVGYETIKEIQKRLPEFQKELVKIDVVFNKFHEKINQNHVTQKSPFQIRGKGFMRGLWFYNQKENFCATLMKNILKKGFLVLPGGSKAEVLSLTPPLIAKASHYKDILNTIGETCLL